MKNEIQITNININIGEKTITLTLKQAEELHKILDDTFHKKEIKFVPSMPVVIHERPYRHWDVIYGGTGFGSYTSGSTGQSNMTLSCKP